MTYNGWLEAEFPGGRLLGRRGERRLWILSQSADWIWRALGAGLSPGEITAQLAADFGADPASILASAKRLEALRSEVDLSPPNTPCVPPARASAGRDGSSAPPGRAEAAPTWKLLIGLSKVRLHIGDPRIARIAGALLAHLRYNGGNGQGQAVDLLGNPAGWFLLADGDEIARGKTLDEAIVQLVIALHEIGCRDAASLFVAHGAALAKNGRALLLAGKSGSGKTTLAAALNASGWSLLSDDTVPIAADGRLIGLGLSMCVKAGAWGLFKEMIPELERLPRLDRHGEAVRFLPPRGRVTRGPIPARALVFPAHLPQGTSRVERLSAAQILSGLVEAGCYIPDLDADRLNRLAHWVQSVPGFSVEYRNLENGMEAVATLLLA